MNLTVLISTWNNAERLGKTLANIAACNIPEGLEWEIVLVKNNCSDHTDSIIERYSRQLPINTIDEPVQGLSRARNSGLRAATGQFVLFTDDDVCPAKDWINIYWNKYLEFGDGYYYGGPVESDFEVTPELGDYIKYAPFSIVGISWGGVEREVSSDEPLFISANWGCSRKKIEETGGFNEKMGLNAVSGRILVGEESAMMIHLQEIGLRPRYLPEAKIRHFVPKEKLTRKHIERRWRASSYWWGRFSRDYDLEKVPRWMYNALVKNAISWMAHIGDADTTDRYFEMMSMYERIKGVRDRIKEREQR